MVSFHRHFLNFTAHVNSEYNKYYTLANNQSINQSSNTLLVSWTQRN